MATLSLTGNAGSLMRLSKQLTAALATTSETKSTTVTLDDADFSVTYTDGTYGSVKKGHK
jgi:hypothetical protein